MLLPAAYEGWLESLSPGAPGQDPFGLPWLPRSRVPGCGAEARAEEALRIDAPADGSVYVYAEEGGESQAIMLAASAQGAALRASEVELLVDGEVVGRSRSPFRATYRATRGDHELVVRPADPRLPARTASARFSVR